ncbi:uncharacterized protein CELE_Y116A8C.29 [Caenorhabditis elegans]|uniref:Secreted protein n=1 Tax=Caenorhabditis elegans TaxID=6239 RepID=Q9U2U2_CAEEL|nr:Secreted protein [Caenorhabditis elegans]CAB55135.2 Secreted protein [Caenorhabditis elegans]|eukprot:NP_503030.2 Uncharacterized protein CELE_Y116A8C.29 [Caenorhabditis elegans]
MTLHNIALHLLPVFIFAIFLIILIFVCRKADSKIISRFSSRRSSQMSLASRKSSSATNPRQCAMNLVTNSSDFMEKEPISEKPVFV